MNNNIFSEYLFDNEKLLWYGKRRKLLIGVLKGFVTAFYILAAIFLIVLITVKQWLFAAVLVVVGAIFLRMHINSDNESYAVTDMRVLKLRGRSVYSEYIKDITRLKIKREDDNYSRVDIGVKISGSNDIVQADSGFVIRGECFFNELENSEALKAVEVIMKEAEKLHINIEKS